MIIKEYYQIGNLIRLLAPPIKDMNELLSEKFICIDDKYYFSDRKAIVIAYGSDCTFSIQNPNETAIAIGSDGKLYLIRDRFTWGVVGHTNIKSFIDDLFNSQFTLKSKSDNIGGGSSYETTVQF